MLKQCLKCGDQYDGGNGWRYLKGALSGPPQDENKIFINLDSHAIICAICHALEDHPSIWGEIRDTNDDDIYLSNEV